MSREDLWLDKLTAAVEGDKKGADVCHGLNLWRDNQRLASDAMLKQCTLDSYVVNQLIDIGEGCFTHHMSLQGEQVHCIACLYCCSALCQELKMANEDQKKIKKD